MIEREQYMAGPAAAARIEKEGEKWTLALVREFRHQPEKVWRALTDPVHLREWAPYEADGSLAVQGSKVNLGVVGSSKPQVSETTITRAEAPRLLEYKWGEQDLRWELEPFNGGTRLKLWHCIARDYIAMGAAGWHICFDVLEQFLNGTPIGRIVGGDAMQYGWPRLRAEYAQQFGL